MANHDGESCAEYNVRMEELKRRRERDEQDDEASQAEVKRIAMECAGCHAQIEKNGGCDHMTCLFSQHQYPLSRLIVVRA